MPSHTTWHPNPGRCLQRGKLGRCQRTMAKSEWSSSHLCLAIRLIYTFVHSLTYSVALFQKIFERQRKVRYTSGEISHPLVHSPKGLAKSATLVSHMGDRDPSARVIWCFLRHINRGLAWKWSGIQTGVLL